MSDYELLMPELILGALALLVLVAGLLMPPRSRHMLGYVSALGLAALLGFSLTSLWGETDAVHRGLFRIDAFALFFKGLFLLLGGVVALASVEGARQRMDRPGVYYAALLLAVLGMMLMAGSGELLTAYLSLELASISLYVLVSSGRGSGEASTRFILAGAFSSALLLYGISQIYGLLGTTRFDGISEALVAAPAPGIGVIVGFVLVIAGLGFKVAAVPFHRWAPVVYGGVPAPVGAFLAVGSIAAIFALLLRLFTEGLLPAVDDWQMMVVVMAALTMTFGSLLALMQRTMPRLLAYSSIGHVGYLLLGVAALAAVESGGGISVELSDLAVRGVMLHLVAYSVAIMAAFLVLAAVHHATRQGELGNFTGIGRRAPVVGIVMSAALLSLAGVPVLACFLGKLFLFSAAWKQGLTWPVGLAVLASLVSLYHYSKVVRRMYLRPAEEDAPIRVPKMAVGILGVLLAGIVYLGVYPVHLIDAIEAAGGSLLSSEGVIRLLWSLD